MKQAVLLLAHGAPEHTEDIPAYMTNVRGGRPTPPAIVAEVTRRYQLIGGGSPLTARTREQAAALQRLLPFPVYFAMRNWHPYIKDTMARMQADGIEQIVALCLAPQYSKSSVGLYFRRVQEAKQELGLAAEIVWTKSFHDHPLLAAAFAERLAPLLKPCGAGPLACAGPPGPASSGAPGRPTGGSAADEGVCPTRVLFTAHSLPERALEGGDPYAAEARGTAAAVAAHAGLAEWDFAFQSQGMTDDKWLGPSVESRIDEYARAGVREMVLAPVGFVCDHVEIAYDVDIVFREYARERGIRLTRPESLNDSPLFAQALAEVVKQKLCIE